VRNGFEVCDLVVYENYMPEVVPLELERPAIAVFASPSAADAFFWANTHLKDVVWCAAIGPTTEQALNKLGAKKISIAQKPDNDHLLQTVLDLVRSGGLE
jgi:uroporphyrinogen-III synthase